MRLISLNDIVPEMKHAPHRIYMLEFDHTKGELAEFELLPLEFLQRMPAFRDVTDKTTLNVLGVEGDKEGRVHDDIKNTHALVADLRPLGIYFLFWKKRETAQGFQASIKNGLLSKLMTPSQGGRSGSKTGSTRSKS